MQNSHHQIDRIHWIDLARGICILAVVLYHTESYYIDVYHVFQYNWLSNCLKVFFFLSGYLLYKKDQIYDNQFLTYKIKRIVKTLVIPYFFFTLFMAVPKAFVHDIDLKEVMIDIVLGNASWFVATLVSAELLFILILRLNKSLYIHISLTIISVIGLMIEPYLENITINPWCVLQTSVVTIFLYLGFLFHQYEALFKNVNLKITLTAAIILIILIKIIVHQEDKDLSIYPLIISNSILYLIDGIVGIILIISISKLISSNQFMEYAGKLSIIIYFLNGGVSVITSTIMNKIGFAYDEMYYRVLIVFLINTCILFIISHIIYCFFPFIIGRK